MPSDGFRVGRPRGSMEARLIKQSTQVVQRGAMRRLAGEDGEICFPGLRSASDLSEETGAVEL